jgi:hypothetical protein
MMRHGSMLRRMQIQPDDVGGLVCTQTRCTLDLLKPNSAAILRHDQWVDPSLGFCCVFRTILACMAAFATRGWLS